MNEPTQPDPVPNMMDIIRASPSSTPLQDYQLEHGKDAFDKVVKRNMTYGDPAHVSNLDIDEDTKTFLDDISNQLNAHFMGKGGKGYWYHRIEFDHSPFSGYGAHIRDKTICRFGFGPLSL
jgi:hypothetical protein